MVLAQFILDLFEPDEDSLRTWVRNFDSDLENSIFWKQSLSAVANDLELQLTNRGLPRRRKLWRSLAEERAEHAKAIWKMANAFGIALPTQIHRANLTDLPAGGRLDPLFTELIPSEAAAQVRSVIRGLRKRRPFGRETMFSELNKAVEAGRSGPILLDAPTGFGKSTVLAHWGESLPSRNFCLVQHFFNRAYGASTSVRGAYLSLWHQLCRATNRRRQPTTDDQLRDLIAVELSIDRSPDCPLVVLLDGLDEADEVIEPFVSLGKNVYVVASVRTPFKGEAIVAKPWRFTAAQRLSLPPLAANDIEDWVQTTVPATEDASSLADRLVDLTSGVPLEVKFLVDDLESARPRSSEIHSHKLLTEQHSVGFEDYCRRQLHHLEASLEQTPTSDHHGPDVIRRMFAVLVCARGPIPEDELATILKVRDGRGVRTLPNLVSRWLAFVPSSGISFDSPRLATTFQRIMAETPGMDSYTAQGRSALVDHCREWRSHLGRYALMYLPAHLMDEDGPAAVRSLLLEPTFLRARLAVHDPLPMIRRTVDDFIMLGAKAGDEHELNRISAFWSTHESVLISHVAAFGQTKLTDVFDQLADDLQLPLPQESPTNGWRIRAGHPGSSSPALRRELTGHDGPIEGATELSNGQIVSWSMDRTIRRWARDGAELAVLRGHEGGVTGVHPVADGGLLSWGRDPSLRLWKPSGECTVFEGHDNWVLGAKQLSDGRLLSWSHDGTLHTWNHDGQTLARFEQHQGSVTGALELPDGRILSWGQDATLRIWSLSGQLQHTLEGHDYPVLGALHLPEANRIASWSMDGTVRIWTNQGQAVSTVSASRGPISGVERSAKGHLVCWNVAGELQIFNRDGQSKAAFRAHERLMAGATVLPDDSIVTWSYDETIRWWHHDGVLKAILSGHSAGVRDVLVLPEDRGFLSWGDDGTLRLWGRDGSHGQVMYGQLGWGMSGASLLSGDRVLSWGGDGALRIWSATRLERSTKSDIPVDEVTGCLQRSDGSLWSWCRSGRIVLRRSDGVVKQRWLGRGRTIKGARLLKDDHLLSWTLDGTLRVWSDDGERFSREVHAQDAMQLSDGRILSWGDAHELDVWTVDGTHDGQLSGHTGGIHGAIQLTSGAVITWSSDRTVRVWSPDGKAMTVLHHPFRALNGAKPLPGGGWVSWGDYRRIFVWDRHGNQTAMLAEHGDGVSNVIVLSDDKILSISLDRTLRLWHLDDRQFVEIGRHKGLINGARPLSNRRFLSWSDDRTLRLWSDTGRLQQQLHGHTQWIGGAVEHQNRLYSFGADGTFRQWTMDGVPRSMWVSPGGSRIKRARPHRHENHLFWVMTQHDVVLVGFLDDNERRPSRPYNP